MSRYQSRYRRDALLELKSQTDIRPMLFRARYLHRDGRWCTFASVEIVYPEGLGSIACGHINIARSVVEVHQVLAKSEHHRKVYFCARVGSYWYHGDRRGNLLLERLVGTPSLWLSTDADVEQCRFVIECIDKLT